MKVSDYWQHDDERPYLHKACDHALGDDERIEYAAIVERRDPERAEWLRLEMALHSRATTDGGVESEMLGRPDPVAMWAERLFPEGTR